MFEHRTPRLLSCLGWISTMRCVHVCVCMRVSVCECVCACACVHMCMRLCGGHSWGFKKNILIKGLLSLSEFAGQLRHVDI